VAAAATVRVGLCNAHSSGLLHTMHMQQHALLHVHGVALSHHPLLTTSLLAATLQDLADSASDQPHKHEGGRQLRSQAAGKGLLSGWPAGQPGAGGSSSARPALSKVDSLDSQKEMDALQGLCDLRGSL
jgi:hypothetical protein